MHRLALAVMLATMIGDQQPPCDLIPEREIPNCQFTVRSNYALHGRVHTARVITRELSPDPRTRHPNSRETPKLSVQEPGQWVVFSPDGYMIESGILSQDGSPIITARDRKVTDGLKTVTFSGTADDPEAIRNEGRFSPDGELIDELTYEHDKLTSRHVQERDDDTGWTEDMVYNANGDLESHSSIRHDKRGREVEWIVSGGGRLVLHQRDTYDETSEGNDDSALTSRAWFDQNGLLFREITLRKGQAISWWQRPKCGSICGEQTDGVGLNFPFDHSVFYEFNLDGSLLTTIQHHKDRYGNIDNNVDELLDRDGKILEKIAYSYERDEFGNWTERTVSILDPATGQMVDVRLDKRDLTYY